MKNGLSNKIKKLPQPIFHLFITLLCHSLNDQFHTSLHSLAFALFLLRSSPSHGISFKVRENNKFTITKEYAICSIALRVCVSCHVHCTHMIHWYNTSLFFGTLWLANHFGMPFYSIHRMSYRLCITECVCVLPTQCVVHMVYLIYRDISFKKNSNSYYHFIILSNWYQCINKMKGKWKIVYMDASCFNGKLLVLSLSLSWLLMEKIIGSRR